MDHGGNCVNQFFYMLHIFSLTAVLSAVPWGWKGDFMMRNRDMPASSSNAVGPNYDGLTKREAAAIAAMQGLLAANRNLPAGTNDKNANVYVARNAVSYADALFDELEKVDD